MQERIRGMFIFGNLSRDGKRQNFPDEFSMGILSTAIYHYRTSFFISRENVN
jgi:hypothetical protein